MKIVLYIILFISLIIVWAVEKLRCPNCGKMRIADSKTRMMTCMFCGNKEIM